MSSVPASPRRATYDAIALALAFLALDAVLIFAVLADWVDGDTGVVAVLAIGAVVLLLFRDDVAEAFAAGNQMLGISADDEPVRRALDRLSGEGWAVEHDVSNARGMLSGTLVRGTSGAPATTGRLKWKPCPSWQPCSRKNARCSSVSIPSASGSRPRFRASWMIEETKTAEFGSCGRSCTKERSIFSVLTRIWFRRLSEECPLPKSSIASRSPRSCNAASTGSMCARDSTIIADSVISIISRSGLSPKDSMVERTCRMAVGCQKEGGRLIET